MTDSANWIRKYAQEDFAASTIRTILGLAGPVGVIVAEFLTQFVPRQRIDRLNDFVDQLGQRLADVEEQFKARLHESAEYGSLAEQVSVAAVRSPSSERRRDLAELLRHGLSRPDAELVEQHALLQLLEQLNDPQVLILMRYGSFKETYGDPRLGAFIDLHSNVFVQAPAYGDTEEKIRAWTMYRHYEAALVGLQLLEDEEGIGKSSYLRKLRITPLGRFLLAAIGRDKP